MVSSYLSTSQKWTRYSNNSDNSQLKTIPGLGTSDLSNLKNSTNPSSKLFNWNIIVKELEVIEYVNTQKLGFKIGSDQKSLLVAGDEESIFDLIIRIYDFEKKRALQNGTMTGTQKSILKKQRKAKGSEGPLDIMTLNTSRALTDTESTLEYILISICQALQIQPKQAAGMLTNHNHYLLHTCIKGVKSNYEPILQWYQMLYSTSKHLSGLIIESFLNKLSEVQNQSPNDKSQGGNNSGYMLLNSIKCGLFSDEISVAEWTAKLFVKMSLDFALGGHLHDFYAWYIMMPTAKNGQLGGGLEATLYCLSKHPNLIDTLTQLLAQTFQTNFDKILIELRSNHTQKNQIALLQIVNELLPFLFRHNKQETSQKVLYESGIIEDCLRQSGSTDEKNAVSLRSQCISLLVQTWSLDHTLIQDNTKMIEENTSLAESTLKVLKRGCRESNRVIRLCTLGQMFGLLDQFAIQKNNQAPVLYKILTFSLIENHADEVTREFMMHNFTEIFNSHSAIPVGILIDPLLKIINAQAGQTYSFNVFDFEFFASLSKHPKLQLHPFGVSILDFLAKSYLQYPFWASAISVPFILLADRFQQEQEMQDFLIKFCSLAITSFLSLKKAFELINTKKQKDLDLPPHLNGEDLSLEDDQMKKIRRFNICSIVRKICNLKISDDFNDQIREIIMATNRRHKQLYGTMNRGFVHLLDMWYAKGKQAMDDYMKQVEEEQKKQEKMEEKKLHKQALEDERARIQAKYYHNTSGNEGSPRKEMGYMSGNGMEDDDGQMSVDTNGNVRRGSQRAKQRALVPWIYKEPKNPIERKALKELEHIKTKRDQKILQQKYDEDKKKQKDETQKQKIKQEITKRKLELGIFKQNPDENQLVLYQPPIDEVETERTNKQQNKTSNFEQTQVALLDLETEEEERDRDGVKIMLNRYQKVFKFLFNKYAMSRSQHMKVQNFDYYSDKTINIAELNKLLRDHDVTQTMINKQKVLQLFQRLIATLSSTVKQQNLQALGPQCNGFWNIP